MEPVLTKSLQSKQNHKAHDFKVVVHVNNKNNRGNNSMKNVNIASEHPEPVDMKRARFEVYKFSKSNLDVTNRQKSNVELAILLGAKPKKNKGKNYKVLKEDRKLEAAKKEEAKHFRQLSLNFKSKMNSKKNGKLHGVKSQGILSDYGKAKHKEKSSVKKSKLLK